MEIRLLNEQDYDTLCGWWKDWGMEAPPKDFLPQDATGGIMILDNEMPICAGFIYGTTSKIAWINWIVSNKQYTIKEKRKEALILLLETLINLGKTMDYKYIYTLFKNKHLVNLFECLGFINGCEYTSEMIKKL